MSKLSNVSQSIGCIKARRRCCDANQGSVFKIQDGLQGGTVRTDCQNGIGSIHVQVVQRSPEHRLLARFVPRPPGARNFRSFDKVGRPQLRSVAR